jgi:3-oxo-5alpha-steroid 4-dehydrogenase
LKAACLKAGAKTLLQAAARRLVIDPLGRVLGAEFWCMPEGSKQAQLHARLSTRAERLQNFAPGYCNKLRKKVCQLERDFARPRRVQARHGVILSTGGFIFNRQLLEQHAPKFRRNFKVGATGCDGSGLRLGTSVGGQGSGLERVSAWRFINPPYSWHKGIVVNREGRRFCNEEVYGATLGQPLMEEQGGKAWLVLDAPLRKKAIREALFGGYWWFQSFPALALMLFKVRKGKSLSELASATAMDPAVLRASVLAANAAARGEAPEPFGKSEGGRQVLEQGPFYACDISVTNPVFPLGALTLGGLRVDERSGAVLDQHGQAISGLSLADCVFSGRRAGAAAAHPHRQQAETIHTHEMT